MLLSDWSTFICGGKAADNVFDVTLFLFGLEARVQFCGHLDCFGAARTISLDEIHEISKIGVTKDVQYVHFCSYKTLQRFISSDYQSFAAKGLKLFDSTQVMAGNLVIRLPRP